MLALASAAKGIRPVEGALEKGGDALAFVLTVVAAVTLPLVEFLASPVASALTLDADAE